jgi:hypothetical protein
MEHLVFGKPYISFVGKQMTRGVGCVKQKYSEQNAEISTAISNASFACRMIYGQQKIRKRQKKPSTKL